MWFGFLMIAAAVQSGGSGARGEYVACLKTASAEALKANVPVDGFEAFAQSKCADIEGRFKSGLVSTAIKNGMSKSAAADDAKLQIGDYLFTAKDNYADKVAHPN